MAGSPAAATLTGHNRTLSVAGVAGSACVETSLWGGVVTSALASRTCALPVPGPPPLLGTVSTASVTDSVRTARWPADGNSR